MLLVRQVYVVEQWALARQESAGQLERLGVPELGLLLLDGGVERIVFFHLDDEADLGRVAEVGDGQPAHLLDKCLASQLKLVLPLLDQILQLVRLKLHDGADGELGGPLSLVEVAQDVLHIHVLLGPVDAVALRREVDEKLLVVRLEFVLSCVQGENASFTVLFRLNLAAAATSLRCT